MEETNNKKELIQAAILQLTEERKKKKKSKEEGINNEGDEEEELLSRLLSQLDSLEKDESTTNLLKCTLEKEEPSSSVTEPNDCGAKDLKMDEIVKELKRVKRQNFITHCLLSVMIIITATWQLSEVSLLMNLKEKVSNPMKAFRDMIAGPFKGKGKKNAIEAPSLPQLNLPELPQMELSYLNGDDDE